MQGMQELPCTQQHTLTQLLLTILLRHSLCRVVVT